MSASIYYEKVKAGRMVPAYAKPAFMAAMQEAFGNGSQWTLSGVNDATVLRGMAAADPHNREAYELLRNALDASPEGVRVWIEY